MDTKIRSSFYRFDKQLKAVLVKLDQNATGKFQSKPSENEWSIVQVLDHLHFSQQGSLDYCRKKIKAGDSLPNSGWFDAIKMKIYLLFLFSPIKFKAPKVVSNPSNEWAYEEIKERHIKFLSDLEAFVASYPKKYADKAIFRHPIAGRITVDQMIRFFEAHLRHHEFQINRLLKQYNTN